MLCSASERKRRRSKALTNAGVTWEIVSLDKWLADPGKLIPDTDMEFRLTKPEARSEIIA